MMKARKTKILKLICKNNRPIKIKSKTYGNLELLPLADVDFSFLCKIIEIDPPARDFTIKIIRRKLKNPKLGERVIQDYPDDYLARIATRLIKDRRMGIKDLPEGKITFELFKQKIVEYVSETAKIVIDAMAPHSPRIIDFQNNWMNDREQGKKLLEECGYRHIASILKKEGFRKFANISQKANDKTIDVTVTNMWLKLSRQDWFENELKERFQNSAVLYRRWKIIKKALDAHKRRNYLLSIPALFSQIEGILGDALILNHYAKSKNGRLFALDFHGAILMENGKQKELISISAIIDQPYFRGISGLEEILKFLREDKIINMRNAILHGRNISYGRAKLSTQLLLLVCVLMREPAICG